MAKQNINIGTVANDGTGDTLRDAFDKTKNNFDEVYTIISDANNIVYSTSNEDLWVGNNAPNTVSEAIDRLASAIKILSFGTKP